MRGRFWLGLAALGLAYLVAWPIPIEPRAWDPPPAPILRMEYAVNSLLSGTQRLAEGECVGPEDVAVGPDGRLYAGMQDGRIRSFRLDGSDPRDLVDTGGRPLGLHFDSGGRLIVADADKGLLAVSGAGEIEVLATEHGGVPFKFTDDLDIAADGRIYFSDASRRWRQSEYRNDFFEHRANGRLLRYDPARQRTELLVDDLYFANGVSLSPDESFVLVVETSRYRVQRHWLRGPRAGETEIFIDNLPGIPDGISRGWDQTFWLALFTERNGMLDRLLPNPWLRSMVFRLPRQIQPQPRRHGHVLGLRADGTVIHNLQDPQGGYAPVTSVEAHGGMLYLGSLEETAIGRVVAPR